ncbi:MAG: DUF3795 domain-containing protein [Pseudomonadota bacterium]
MGQGTGACGINCMVCGLFRQGKCSPCAAGVEPEADKKLAVQLGLLGGTCPILQCARDRKIGYCSADCQDYPCKRFQAGPYPFSQGYLDMQFRRRGRPGLGPVPSAPPEGSKPH